MTIILTTMYDVVLNWICQRIQKNKYLITNTLCLFREQMSPSLFLTFLFSFCFSFLNITLSIIHNSSTYGESTVVYIDCIITS